jgi:hypothetical protein
MNDSEQIYNNSEQQALLGLERAERVEQLENNTLQFSLDELLEQQQFINVNNGPTGHDCWSCYDFVLDAVRKSGLNLQYASENLKNNKSIVINALNNYNDNIEDYCEIFKYASNELKNDIEIILYVAQKSYEDYRDGRIFNYLSNEIKYDYDFIYQYCLINYDIPMHIFTNEFINLLSSLKDDTLVNTIDPNSDDDKIRNINDYNISNYFDVINDNTLLYNNINIDNIFIPKFKKIEIILNEIVKTILSNRIVKDNFTKIVKEKIIKDNMILILFKNRKKLININQELINYKEKNNDFNERLLNIIENENNKIKNKIISIETEKNKIKNKIISIENENKQFKYINNIFEHLPKKKLDFLRNFLISENNFANEQELINIKEELINIKQKYNNLKLKLINIKQKYNNLEIEFFNIKEINDEFKEKINNFFELKINNIKQENNNFKNNLINILNQENNELKQEIFNIKEINNDFQQELNNIKYNNNKLQDYLINFEQKLIVILHDNINKNLINFIILLYNLLLLYIIIINK